MGIDGIHLASNKFFYRCVHPPVPADGPLNKERIPITGVAWKSPVNNRPGQTWTRADLDPLDGQTSLCKVVQPAGQETLESLRP